MTNLKLASGSFARQNMLKNAGFTFDVLPADINEQEIKNNFNGDHTLLAEELAKQKALHISKNDIDSYVIGSDQLLTLNGDVLSKAKDKEEAKDKLQKLSGRTHTLISSVVVTKGCEVVFQNTDEAHLTMHSYDDDFLARYIDSAGNIVTQCVGAYALEGTGIQLFSDIKGDYFTILGMPLLPLVSFLQSEGMGL